MAKAKKVLVCNMVITLKNVVSIHNEIASLNIESPAIYPIDFLDEDLLQIEFANGNIIDVGWYPAFDETGEFVISVIKENNWTEPFLKLTAKDRYTFINQLNDSICEALISA